MEEQERRKRGQTRFRMDSKSGKGHSSRGEPFYFRSAPPSGNFFPFVLGIKEWRGLENQTIISHGDKGYSCELLHVHIPRTQFTWQLQESGMSSFTLHIRKWKFEGFLFSAKDEVQLNSKVISFSPNSVVKILYFPDHLENLLQNHHFSSWLHFTLLNVHYFG